MQAHRPSLSTSAIREDSCPDQAIHRKPRKFLYSSSFVIRTPDFHFGGCYKILSHSRRRTLRNERIRENTRYLSCLTKPGVNEGVTCIKSDT